MATVVLHSTAADSSVTDLDYASLSYDATKVYYLSAVLWKSSPPPDTPTPTLTNATFTPLTTAMFPSSNQYRFCVWRVTVSTNTTAVLHATPSLSGLHYIDSHLVECTGYDLATPEAQSPKRGDQADLVSVTFTITADSVPAAGNSMLWMSGYSGYNYTPGTGFTELADTNSTIQTTAYTQWKNTGDQVAETTAPANDGYSMGLLIELALAVAAVPRQPVPIVGASQAAQRASRW